MRRVILAMVASLLGLVAWMGFRAYLHMNAIW